MKLTLLGNSRNSAVTRLAEEAANLGVDFTAVSMSSLILEVKNNNFSLTSKTHRNLLHNDCYLFRGIGDATQEAMVLAKYLTRHGATIIEENTATGTLMMDKLFLRAIEASVPTPDHYIIQNIEALRHTAHTLTFPIVIKSTTGSMGKNVALAKDKAELFALYKQLGNRVVIQDYIPVDFDVRAIVIGGTFVGAYKRTRNDGEFRMNQPGNTKQPIVLPPQAVEICEHAAASQNIEIAGIDIIQYQDRWYVLEINTSPQFKMFEKYTDINLAKSIIEYAISKTTKNARSKVCM